VAFCAGTLTVCIEIQSTRTSAVASPKGVITSYPHSATVLPEDAGLLMVSQESAPLIIIIRWQRT